MDNMLEGIRGAYAIIDDILIAAKTLEEHDRILRQVMKRASSYNLKLNFRKTNLRQTQVSYVSTCLKNMDWNKTLQSSSSPQYAKTFQVKMTYAVFRASVHA